jgi:hypothetical protein
MRLAVGLVIAPLLWTAPAPVDVQPIDAVSCPATSLCVAVDRAGGILSSTDPAGGRGSWHRADVDGSNELTGLSCPSTTLCVAVDAAGNVVTSEDPGGGRSAWAVAQIDSSPTQNNTDNAGAVLVRGVSCPSTTLCVAVDAAGNALLSTNPTGGTAGWISVHVDTNSSYGCNETGPPALTCQPPLVGVACPSVAQCVAVDFSGNVLSTATPGAPLPWASTPIGGGGLSSLWGISCPASGFCATVDGIAGRVITFNPAAPATQTSRSLPYSLYGIWCQSQSLCLASAQTPGGISGLVGSVDPLAPGSTWSLSSLGGVNAIACPATSPLCLAADDEGNIATGATTAAIRSALNSELLNARHLPTTVAVSRGYRFAPRFTTPIAAQVTLTWTAAESGTSPPTPLAVATATHSFPTPGTAPLALALTAAGRQLFATATGPVRLTATATFAASTGSISSTTQLSFPHPRPRPKRRRHH